MSANTLYDQVTKILERPFAPDDVQWKPQSTSRDKKRALAVAYVDPRIYISRLDEAVAQVEGCPPWEKRLEIHDMGDRVAAICHLTIAGVKRSGDGECVKAAGKGTEPNAVTSASAQAFKRANVEHGLGRYLYGIPKVWVDYDESKRSITPQSLAQLKRMLETGEQPGGGNGRGGQASHRPARNQASHRAAHSDGEQDGNGRKDARAIILQMGDKHKGKTLGQIAVEDPGYIKWLSENWRWDEGRKAAEAIWGWIEKQQSATSA
jgi:hypothetical protein